MVHRMHVRYALWATVVTVFRVPAQSGWTPLHMAARRGHLACTEALLDAKANIEARNNVRQRPCRRKAPSMIPSAERESERPGQCGWWGLARDARGATPAGEQDPAPLGRKQRQDGLRQGADPRRSEQGLRQHARARLNMQHPPPSPISIARTAGCRPPPRRCCFPPRPRRNPSRRCTSPRAAGTPRRCRPCWSWARRRSRGTRCGGARRGGGARVPMLTARLSKNVPRACPCAQDGNTPLHEAALNGHVACALPLLDAGLDLEAANTVRQAPAASPRDSVLPLFFREARAQGMSPSPLSRQAGNTPLLEAARNGKAEFVAMVLERGGRIDAKNRARSRPQICLCLHFTPSPPDAHRGTWPPTPAPPRGAQDSRTALHLAAAEGHLETVQVLLERNPDRDAHDDVRSTAALHR